METGHTQEWSVGAQGNEAHYKPEKVTNKGCFRVDDLGYAFLLFARL